MYCVPVQEKIKLGLSGCDIYIYIYILECCNPVTDVVTVIHNFWSLASKQLAFALTRSILSTTLRELAPR